ncbi:uncharacterized protein N7529_001434 [Penicillium soppii]|uniref:uncharacterized protein n=1 Tax=Penicillium soppii TaxID=69789 RepID=UPI002547B288|nr:uncharacterized protein N7529_001434 [Penicillium soppii]KAJ5875850.1 hypothetical protein N7529_001434 [Penicillium soppii]
MASSRPSKRQRICRACDQCRRRKSKCDGEQPVCSICRAADRPCTYQNGGGRRGLAPGYVRSLETVLGLVLQHVPNSESMVHDLLARSRNDHFVAKDPANVWRKSRLAKDLSKLLDQDPQDSSAMTISDEFEWDTSEITNTSGVITGDTAHTTSVFNEPEPALEEINLNNESRTRECLDLPYPPNTLSVLENYFTYTHCWFPIMERHDLLRTMHTGSQAQHTQYHGSRLALWALVAYETFTNDNGDRRQSNYSEIQDSIGARIMTQSSNLELGHIQAALVFTLLQIKLGDLLYAWRLAGQASRMLASLPAAAKKNRYHHTFHGCIFLDNLLSSLLNKAPCMSLAEQRKEEMINEDNMEEWDVWTISPQGSDGQRPSTPQGPLRALSIFNKVNNLMEYLARILYVSTDTPGVDRYEITNNLQAEQTLLAEEYPYSHSPACATPPILMLHLTCNFVILALSSTSPTLDTVGNDLAGRVLQSTVILLDLYVEITGASRVSPLLLCFALQGQQCLNAIFHNHHSEEREALETRLSSYIPSIQTETRTMNGLPENRDPLTDTPLSRARNNRSNAPNNGLVQPSALHAFNSQLGTPISIPSVDTVSGSKKISAHQSPTEATFVDLTGFDALFEEMVTSIPSNRTTSTAAGWLTGWEIDDILLKNIIRDVAKLDA